MQITRENFYEMKTAEQDLVERCVNDNDIVFERKWDGTAGILNYSDDRYSVVGRGVLKNGMQQDYTEVFPEIIVDFKQLCKNIKYNMIFSIGSHTTPELVLIGEIVNMKDDGNEYFKGIEQRCNRKTDREKYAQLYPAKFMIFDVLRYNGISLINQPFYIRRKFIQQLMKYMNNTSRFILAPQATTPKEKQLLINLVNKGSGVEGLVAKNLNASFNSGIYKYKFKKTEDVFWEGEYKEGNGRHVGRIGALLCYQYVRGKKVQVAAVGGGLTDKLRDELTAMVSGGEVSKDKPMVIEIQAHEVFPTGKMRYPNWIRQRFDKSPIQCISSVGRDEVEEEDIVVVNECKPKKVVTQSLDDWM